MNQNDIASQIPLARGLSPGLTEFDFANILFAGPCNRFCPFCIGKEVPAHANVTNLDLFPLRNWDNFVAEVRRLGIREIVFTGTTTDPHLYAHERRLIDQARKDIPGAQISIHTNAALTLKKIDSFNAYDRACLSLPTMNSEIYRRMMGVAQVPDLRKILAAAKIPVKVSCVVNEHNAHEVDGFLHELAALGVKRAVLRRLYGDRREFNPLAAYTPVRFYRNNPVYEIEAPYSEHGRTTRGETLDGTRDELHRTMEVTSWNFDTTESRSINLFADGTIGSSYLLTETPEFIMSKQG